MDVLQILTDIGYTNLSDFGKNFRTRPLYRDSDNNSALSINKLTGEWYDFVTKQGGGITQLVQQTLRLPTVDDAKEYLGDVELTAPSRDVIELKEVKKFNKELLVKLRKEHDYWLKRGVSKSTIETFEGGITFNGRMAYRYVFPVFDDKDNLVGFSGRRITDNEEFPKWKHLGSKSNWLYPLKWNAQYIMESKKVILVESIGDMLALWDAGIRNTLVTFGIDISVRIVQFLLKIDPRQIVIAFNDDTDNKGVGNAAAQSSYRNLCRMFDQRQVSIALPLEKDFGVMSPEQIDLWNIKYLQPN